MVCAETIIIVAVMIATNVAKVLSVHKAHKEYKGLKAYRECKVLLVRKAR